MNEAVIFQSVSKSFGEVRAVDALDLVIEQGSRVALLGPNGAGKSTSINLLLGLLAPDAGIVALLGGLPEQAVRAGRVGAMPQEAKLIPRVSIAELLGFVRQTYPSPPPLADLLALAKLTEIKHRRVDTLSGGQLQRVRFALALAGRPELIVLDEPTAAMDVGARRELWECVEAYEGTVLFSTHYLEEADEHADRVVVIGRGKVIADGTPDQIKSTVGGRTVSVDVDGTVGGLAELPGVRGVEVREGRAHLRTADSDATVLALAAAGRLRNLEVVGADLEDAFLSLTS
ncbi:ATP-binding cassette domain-containing protein [Nocardia tengchongensis]|uniref:ABC transporter ATP-binding protein n=1 Tax=Nocardia tengchongensis TaxID=2055889 RepID=UPI00369BAF1C